MNPNMIQQINNMKKLAGGNPRDIATMMAKNSNNPLMQQLVQLMEQGKQDKVENFARNFCKEHNMDFDEQVNSFKSMMNMFPR